MQKMLNKRLVFPELKPTKQICMYETLNYVVQNSAHMFTRVIRNLSSGNFIC